MKINKKKVKENFPVFFKLLKSIKGRVLLLSETRYPRVLGNEVREVKRVLRSSQWNMNYGSGLAHEKLEQEFAAFVGTKYAIAVNTGGMAIQITLRALGLKPGDEILHQVDTCVADAFAVMNAGCTPVFTDISLESLMMSEESLNRWISPKTKAIIPIHMWGNAENMDMIMSFAKKHNLIVIEDAALSLGTKFKGKKVGSFGRAAIFSFGCLKPIQAGEGGMIVTDDEQLAKEMKTIRNWGEMTHEYGVRDQRTLSWNGRMSEIVAAIALEQLRAYPKVLEILHKNVALFYEFLKTMNGITPLIPFDEIRSSSFTQLVVLIDEKKLGMKKQDLMAKLTADEIPVWHANFEPINSLSFFKDGHWKTWINSTDHEQINNNYSHFFENSNLVYAGTGIGFLNNNFISGKNVKRLIKSISKNLQLNE